MILLVHKSHKRITFATQTIPQLSANGHGNQKMSLPFVKVTTRLCTTVNFPKLSLHVLLQVAEMHLVTEYILSVTFFDSLSSEKLDRESVCRLE